MLNRCHRVYANVTASHWRSRPGIGWKCVTPYGWRYFTELIDSSQSKAQLKQVDADLRDETLLVHTPVDWVACCAKPKSLAWHMLRILGVAPRDLFHVAAAVELALIFLTR